MPRRPKYMDRSDEWIMNLKMKLRSQGTIKTYQNALKQSWEFAREQGWPSDPKKISPLEISAWLEELQEKAPNTQDDYIGTLLRFLRWEGNTLCKDVDLHIHPARTGRVDWLDSAEEVGRFISTSPEPYDRAVAIVITYTGARASEAADIRLDDMHQDYIRLRGKGRKERNVPVDKEFWEELAPYIKYRATLKTKSQRFLLHLFQGKVWEYNGQSIYAAIDRIAVLFGRHVSPHTLRRTFGRLLWLAGCPLPIIQRLLGHASLEQTIEYLGIGDADLSGAMATFRPSFRSSGKERRE